MSALENDVAIVGMAGRFPGAANVDAFWANVRDGVESITYFSDEELAELGVSPELRRDPSFVPAAAVIEAADMFDHEFWGYAPREAQLIDPQQRLFLETAWEALEHAGYDPRRYEGLIGVYAGMGLSTYLLFNLLAHPEVSESDTPLAMLGNDKDFLTTRVSYHLNLRGPSVAVQSGCSTSLVATHLACEALLSYQCDIALAGGATVAVPQRTGYRHSEGGTASPDGHCRAFDADAAGTLFGSGVGAVVLKRLADAMEQGDAIYAVIKGSAVNNDGADKVGFTAPGVAGQAEVIVRAMEVAGIDPETIGYVEAHGTGTQMGDPIEVAALTKAFRNGTTATGFCALGSVKTNIGHLDTAAGVASLIKTTLMLYHKQLPPSLHYEKPNPQIDFEHSPFFVNTERAEWRAAGPCRAGVSAFGFGGTNAHLVLEEAPARPPPEESSKPQLLVLSARTSTALDAATARLAAHLDARPDQTLSDVAFTLQAGRAEFEWRRAVVCLNRENATEALRTPVPPRVQTSRTLERERSVAFMFPGLGDQYPGMARDLYRRQPVFRDAVDHCAELLLPHLAVDVRDILYASDDGAATADSLDGGLDFRALVEGQRTPTRLDETAVAHPILFAIEYALAELWLSWGVKPAAVIGHSLGEYVAATMAGVFALEDALMLVAQRARLIDELPLGAMLAVPLSADEVTRRTGVELSVALVNGPRLTVVAGPLDAVEAFERELDGSGIATRRLQTTHAFHSPMMEPIVPAFTELVRTVDLAPPSLPYISNVTGTWATGEVVTDPIYWGTHTASTVQFASGLRLLCAEAEQILLEVGPGQALSTLAMDQLEDQGAGSGAVVLPSLRPVHDRRQDDTHFLLDCLGRIWASGGGVDLAALHAGATPRRVDLPTYPFERKRAWLDPHRAQASPAASAGRATPDEWLLAPTWRSLPLSAVATAADHSGERWLVLADVVDLGDELVARLGAGPDTVTVVRPGSSFGETGGNGYVIDPADPAHYHALRVRLDVEDRPLTHVAHLWSLDGGDSHGGVEEALTRGFYSLAFLCQAFCPDSASSPIELCIVSSGLAAVEDGDVLRPEKATLLGLAKSIPQEYEGLTVHCMDVPAFGADGVQRIAAQLLDLVAERPAERLLAYRGERRWAPTFDRLPLAASAEAPHPLRSRGVYVITGGTGRVGLDLAEYLAREVRARIALIGRSPFPAREEWSSWLEAHAEDDLTSKRIRRLLALEEHGAELIVQCADVAEVEQMRTAFAEVATRFGPVNGVIHAAGIAGAGAFAPIGDLDPVRCDAQLRAKVAGCYVLEEVLRGEALDFRLLISSNAALLGGLGFATYSAANTFLDAFAEHLSAADGDRWISVNLEEWVDPGDAPGDGFQTSLTQYGITPAEGSRAIRSIVERARGGRVTLVTGDLEQRLDRWIRHPEAARAHATGPRTRGPRPALAEPLVAPDGSEEAAIAEIWQDILGIEEIGRNDNFFLLGGHSLLAMQIVTRVAGTFDVDVSLLSFFGAPTVAGFAERVRQADRKGAVEAAIPRAQREGPLPASYAQRRFWFLDKLAPGNPFYNIPDVVRIDGPLRTELLEQSVNRIVSRHEALRTTLAGSEDNPVQIIADRVEIELLCVDLTGLDPDERRQELEERAVAEARAPFDLARGPLLRAALLRMGQDEHVLLLTVHHSVSDAWSTGIFIREVGAVYASLREGRSDLLEPLPIQYTDYAVWQLDRLQGETLDRLVDYWREQLSGAPKLTEFTPDYPRPAAQTFSGATHPLNLPGHLVGRVEQLAAGEGCTLFMTLLTAFYCLIHRYTGAGDIVVGSPIAGRTTPEIEGLVGCFVNMLPLRAHVDPETTFADLLQHVRATTLDAFAHQDLPFELLVEELHPERDLSYGPVFQIVFVLQNAPLPALKLGDLTLEPLPMPTVTAKFDLMLMLRETDDGAIGTIEYTTDLYSPETVAGLATAYVELLEDIVRDPGRPVRDLQVEAAAVQERVTGDLAAGDLLELDPFSIPQLFSQQLGSAPARAAVVPAFSDPYDAAALSFAELEERSNQLAHSLRARGIGREARVGVCMKRSAEAIVVLLGIMKAGAAYVPLDPAYPAYRLAFMAADAAVDLVVADDETRTPPVVVAVTVDELRRAVSDAPRTPVPDPPGPDDPAYVIYTSGSTGVPKGVVGLHRGMVNRLRWMWEEFPLAPDDVACQKTSLNFLDSFWEIFGSLCGGVPVVVVPDAVVLDPQSFVDVLRRHSVTRLVVVPSLLRVLLDSVPDLADHLPSLRFCVTSGEALPGVLARRFLEALPGRRLLNLYGASEVSADVTYHLVSNADVECGVIPIGRPIANTSVYVLDERMRSVPLGADGTLYVGGESLARGYLGRPDTTAQAFVPDPFADVAGGRLYRTGDRVRFRSDGTLEYLGRSDQQVKVRGFRVELAEVESALAQEPSIREAVAAVRNDALAAAYVPIAGELTDPDTLRRFLQSRLPDYMIPSVYVPLDELPLTSSGKVDRAALSELLTHDALAAVPLVTPRNATEAVLQGLWDAVFETSGTGVHDNFFLVGGHSLLAIRFVARIRDALEVEFPLQAFFEEPTVAGVAGRLLDHPLARPQIEERAELLLMLAPLSDEDVEQRLSEIDTQVTPG